MKNLLKKSLSGKKTFVSMLAVVVVLAFTAGFLSSCEETVTGDFAFTYRVVDFEDNFDILTRSIDEGFQQAGFTLIATHMWQISGEKKACQNKAKATFQNRCKEIDTNRKNIPGVSILALKGVTVKLINYFDNQAEIDSYTFVEDDPE